jgi:hypothetical protein
MIPVFVAEEFQRLPPGLCPTSIIIIGVIEFSQVNNK